MFVASYGPPHACDVRPKRTSALRGLPADSAFWSHKRVALTAHASANGSGLVARGDDLFLDNLCRFVKNEPLINEANPRDVQGG